MNDPCDSHDEWERRARRTMAWESMVARLVGANSPYLRDYVDALLRSNIIIEPKRRGGDSYIEKGDMITYWAHTANKDEIPVIPDNRRFFIDESYHFVGIDHADGPDRSVDLVKFTKPELKAIKERYDRQQPPHWKGKRPR